MNYIMPLKLKQLIVNKSFADAGGIYFDPIEADLLLQFYYYVTKEEDVSFGEDMDITTCLDEILSSGYDFGEDYKVVQRMFDIALQDRLADKYSLESVMTRMEDFNEEKFKDTLRKMEELEQKKSETIGKLEEII